jgi:hypothetical protein
MINLITKYNYQAQFSAANSWQDFQAYNLEHSADGKKESNFILICLIVF